ncbi:MAG: hypothetical protein AAFM92_03255 [Pseudomonadota bacterium]
MTPVKTTTPERALAAAAAEMFGAFDVAGKDCCRTAGAAFEALWGVNPVVGADYTTHLGALRFLRRYGGADACHDALASRAGLVACEPGPGVIGAVRVPEGTSPLPWALGVHIQGEEWAVMGYSGLNIVRGPARAWGLPWA